MSRNITALLIGLFLVRSVVIWYGYDRLPLLPNTDEVILNDPALAFSRGEGVVSPSFAGTVGLERAYGIHPPLYMFIQGEIFRCLGFSTFTLRFLGIASHLASLGLLLLILARLRKREWVDDFGWTCASLLVLAEPLTFTHARWGRHDFTAIFFGVAAFACLIPARPVRLSKRRWLAAAGLMGLALAAHLQMVLFSVPFSLWAALHFRRSNRAFGAVVIAFPLIVLAAMWLLAFGPDYALAWRQLRVHSAVHYVGFAWFLWLNAALQRDVPDFGAKGGLAFGLIMLSWLVMPARLIFGRIRDWDAPLSWRKPLWLAVAFALCHYILFKYLMGTGAQRVFTALPVAMAGMALGLSHWPRWTKWITAPAVGLTCLAGVALAGGYLLKVKAEWDERDPHRLDALVDSLPREAKIATVPDLWYSFTSRGKGVRVIEQGFVLDDRYWRDHPDAMSEFDLLVLYEGHTFLRDGIVPAWPRRILPVSGQRYVILAKDPSNLPQQAGVP